MERDERQEGRRQITFFNEDVAFGQQVAAILPRFTIFQNRMPEYRYYIFYMALNFRTYICDDNMLHFNCKLKKENNSIQSMLSSMNMHILPADFSSFTVEVFPL